MSEIKYEFGAISSAAADINATSGRINSTLADLKARLQPMVSTWEGESAVAYNQAPVSYTHLTLPTIYSV